MPFSGAEWKWSLNCFVWKERYKKKIVMITHAKRQQLFDVMVFLFSCSLQATFWNFAPAVMIISYQKSSSQSCHEVTLETGYCLRPTCQKQWSCECFRRFNRTGEMKLFVSLIARNRKKTVICQSLLSSLFLSYYTQREPPVEKKLSSNKRSWKMQKRAITDLNAPNGSRDILFQSQEFEQCGRRHFVDF